MLTAFITHTDCLKHDMGQGHPECPDRLWAINDHLLRKGLMELMLQYDAPEVRKEQLLHAHDALYLAELEAASPEQGYAHVDPDTSMNPHTLQAARRSAGAGVLAVDLVLEGKASSAFCAVRPPGHHAERNAAMGFCFYNNIAVAALHALSTGEVSKVAVIDFDVHHGNGTENILAGDERVLMVSTFEKNLYPFSGDTPLGPNMCNVGLPPRSNGEALRAAVTEHWIPALEAFKPEILFISAGFDAHREDDMSNLRWTDADYGWVSSQLVAFANKHCKGRIVSMLEGGYETGALGRAVAAHVAALIGAD